MCVKGKFSQPGQPLDPNRFAASWGIDLCHRVGILVCKVGMTVPTRHAVVPPAPPLGVTLPAGLTLALIVHFYGSEYLSTGVP